jgi:ABC-type glycerol-3-phosphate transport system substrate-binding protein
MMKKILVFACVVVVAFVMSSCRKEQTNNQKVELVYYRLFDDEAVFTPLIQEYQKANPGVTIRYRKFTDPIAYENLILNELAEGRGPDMFSVSNNWLNKNYRKIIPADLSVVAPSVFRENFVDVAAKDLVRGSGEFERVYALPLYVDVLGLFYNKAHFEDRVPSRGKPALTWEGLKEDVFLLTKEDGSFERFEVSGMALGRADNILRAVDVLYLLFLQHKVAFYNDQLTLAVFGQSKAAAQAVELMGSFADSSAKNYSWNQFLADGDSMEKELVTFAKGKVSMIFGYSFTYQQILDQIALLKRQGVSTMDPNDIRVAQVPQLEDPAVSTEKRVNLANYQVEVVGRNTANALEAWNFLEFLSRKENSSRYLAATKRSPSRRDLIDENRNDPIYGVFVEQVGFAENLLLFDEYPFREVFAELIDTYALTKKSRDVLNAAEAKINALLVF